ncbi:MAG TPA: AEC family transporter [Solirubrobacterales bacterium]|nr:AEC family transporter [Solirubrobacterales bacterium]
MGVLLTAAAIVVATAVGVWSERRWPQGAAEAARKALVLILYFLLPPVIFFNLASAHIDLNHGVGLGLAIVAISLTSALVWFVASRVLKLPHHQTGAMICTVLVVNTGYLGYPMSVALLGRDQLSTAVLYDVLVSGPCLLLGAFAVGAAFGTKAGESPRQRVRAFFTRNPPLYAAIAGLLAPSALAPNLLVDISQGLVVAILPIGFFAVGATLAEGAVHGELPMPPPLNRQVLVTLVARLAIAPALLMLLAAPLIDLPATYRLLSAMPTGLNSMVVSHAYGLDNQIVAEAVVWSTAIVVVAALVSLAF